MESYFVGVDVGTGSVRAALVTRNGKLLHTSSKNTKTWSPAVGYFEQSTDDIWRAVCYVVKVKQFFPPIYFYLQDNCRSSNKCVLICTFTTRSFSLVKYMNNR
jgi:hypothetical protein